MRLRNLLLVSIVVYALDIYGQNSFYLGGIQTDESDLSAYYDEMINAGFNTVEVTHYARQGIWNSADLDISHDKSGVVEEIRLAKKKGLKVVLILRVYLKEWIEENKFLWHGMILPSGKALLDNWFEKYNTYCLEWAEIAQREGADALVIGSELNELSSTKPINQLPSLYSYYDNDRVHRRTEERIVKFKKYLKPHHLKASGDVSYRNVESFVKDKYNAQRSWFKEVGYKGHHNRIDKINLRRKALDKYWVDIIASIRKIFNGEIGYAANFDNYQEVGFWGNCDFIGINAYFPLDASAKSCKDYTCHYENCKKGWYNALEEISNHLHTLQIDKPIIFTEIGYTQRRGCTTQPWQSVGYSIVGPWYSEELLVWQDEPIRASERVAAIDALYDVIDQTEVNLIGLLYWKLTAEPKNTKLEPFTLLLSNPIADKLQISLGRFRGEK